MYMCIIVFAGDVALIRGGELHCIGASGPYHYNAGDQFGIVSDRYVKWKGGKIPSDAEKSKVLAAQLIAHSPLEAMCCCQSQWHG